MDDIDRKIITLLAADARQSLAETGAAVGLSASATNERIRRLLASGAIRFALQVAPEAVDLPLLVFVWLALREGADEAAFRAHVAGHPAILECHHVTGGWSYLIKLRVASLAEIEAFLTDLKARSDLGCSETVLALSSPVPGPYLPKIL